MRSLTPPVPSRRDLTRRIVLPRPGVMPGSRARSCVSTGIAEVDAICGGLPRGGIAELCGAPSSGVTTVLLASLAAAADREEVCALVDADDGFDPATARAAGVDLGRLLWVRCHSSLERAFKAADLLLEAGGFGLVVLDLVRVPEATLRRVPPAFWFRFRRSVTSTPTALLMLVPASCAGSTTSLGLVLEKERASWRGNLLVGRRYRVKRVRPQACAPSSCRIEAQVELG